MNEELLRQVLENQMEQTAVLRGLGAKLDAHIEYVTGELTRLSSREAYISAELNRVQGAVKFGAVIMTTGLTLLGIAIAAARLFI